MSFVLKYLLSLLSLCLWGCSGPYTPFGPINSATPPQSERVLVDDNILITEDEESDRGTITSTSGLFTAKLSPPRLVYHKDTNYSLSLSRVGSKVDLSSLRVSYEGKDISSSFIKNGSIERKENNSVVLNFDNIRLPPDRTNEIIIEFVDSVANESVTFSYQEPHCSVENIVDVKHTGDFSPSSYITKAINKIAKTYSINPSLIGGLIAQESSFNPKAISWAKAIGLTQITPLAADQILREHKNWPRDPTIANSPVPVIKYKIRSGHITHEHDFRLNPISSIKGGIVYFKYLERYWKSKRNTKLLEDYAKKDQFILSKAMIASYNFGPARIRRSIIQSGLNWHKNKRALGALGYVNRVQSFCYDFGLSKG